MEKYYKVCIYVYISLHMCVSVYIYDIVYVKTKFRRKRETVVEVEEGKEIL